MAFLDDAVRNAVTGGLRVTAQHSNRASQAGIICKRRLQWHRTKWELASAPKESLGRRFILGTAIEKLAIGLLEQGGITVFQRQRDLRWEKFELTGHLDGVVQTQEGDEAILEIKSAAPYSFKKVAADPTAVGLLASRYEYVRAYVTQVALYCLLMGYKRGFIFFIEKASGASCTVPITLDDPVVLAEAEAALKRYEAVNAAIKEGVDLPAEPADYCDSCPFVHACMPNRSFTGVSISDDEVAPMLDRRQELKAYTDELDRIDEQLKDKFKEPGTFLAGDWVANVREISKVSYEVPESIKKEFAKQTKYLRRDYKRLTPEPENGEEK